MTGSRYARRRPNLCVIARSESDEAIPKLKLGDCIAEFTLSRANVLAITW